MGAETKEQKPQASSSLAQLLQLLIPGQAAKKMNKGVADKVKAATPKK